MTNETITFLEDMTRIGMPVMWDHGVPQVALVDVSEFVELCTLTSVRCHAHVDATRSRVIVQPVRTWG